MKIKFYFPQFRRTPIMIGFMIFSSHLFCQTQKLLSEFWVGSGGMATMFSKNATATDQSRNVYVAGSTINGLNDSDVLIQKFNRSGELLWSQTYAGAGKWEIFSFY